MLDTIVVVLDADVVVNDTVELEPVLVVLETVPVVLDAVIVVAVVLETDIVPGMHVQSFDVVLVPVLSRYWPPVH